ncbi:MAG: mechanosensitive ion channel family protein [Bacteriovoracia bacterium]
MELFGIRLVGFNPENLQKLLLTFFSLSILYLIKRLINNQITKLPREKEKERVRFWTRQGLNLFFALAMLIVFLSIWFDDPRRLTTGLGLVTAGLAFALQKVVTSFAGYLIIMRGNTFSVGERITMGGIRGDVISLGFLQTTIMEMGQPPSVQGANPAMWVRGRQFTGRIVTVTNDKIFETPVYNYTRDFPYIWEEISIPIKYTADRKAVEEILIETVKKHTQETYEKSEDNRYLLESRYGVRTEDILPKVFYRLTDNWLELTVRFITEEHGIRDVKDQISRGIIEQFESRGIEVASSTMEVVGLPRLQLDMGQKEIIFSERDQASRHQ